MVSGVLQIQNNNASFGEFKEILLSLRSPRGGACLSSSPHPIELRFQLVLLGVPCMVLHNLLSLRYARDKVQGSSALASLARRAQASAVRCFHSVFALRARQSWTAIAWSVLMLLCVANAP